MHTHTTYQCFSTGVYHSKPNEDKSLRLRLCVVLNAIHGCVCGWSVAGKNAFMFSTGVWLALTTYTCMHAFSF